MPGNRWQDRVVHASPALAEGAFTAEAEPWVDDGAAVAQKQLLPGINSRAVAPISERTLLLINAKYNNSPDNGIYRERPS